MAEKKKTTDAPAKPRKVATKKKAALTNLTQMKSPTETQVNGTDQTQISASDEQVAQLAHRFWLESGRRHGHHEEDWLRAERELRGKAS
jgi:hypothetical protein